MTRTKVQGIPTEVELKLALPAGARELLEQHEAFRSKLADRREQRSTYFDTADHRLATAGVVLRVRADGDRRRQTVKSRGDGAGLAAARGEWEWDVGQDTPDLSRLSEAPVLSDLRAELGDANLEPIFVSEITRTVRLLQVGGAEVEAAIDEGVVRAGLHVLPVSELELELKDGEVGPLYRFALELHASVPFTIGAETKAARGYRLAGGGAFRAQKASGVRLGSDMTGAAAFCTIVEAAIGDLLANLAGASAGDVESIHQARIALRRLRTALEFFRPYLEPVATARFKEELRTLARSLGEARDWDVFCDDLLLSVGEHTQEPRVLDLLIEAAAAPRHRAHAEVAATLLGSRFTATILGLASWVEDGASAPSLLGSAELAKPAGKLVPGLLDGLARRVSHRGRKIEARSDTELHALRKSLKKLRYGVDDVASLYKPKRVEAYLGRCRDLQELLGTFNDAVTGIELACRLCEEGRPDLTPGLAALGRWGQKRERKVRRRLRAAFERVERAEHFW